MGVERAATFNGEAGNPRGLGPFQQQEYYALLQEFMQRKMRIIPVFLATAPTRVEVPPLLRGFSAIDFRGQSRQAFEELRRLVQAVLNTD